MPTAGDRAIDALILCTAAYGVGSVPFAWLLGRARGIDIRRVGSGNIGATNLGRALGRRWAIAAFVLDFLKGLVAVLLARAFFDPDEGWARATLEVLAGTSAILGHVAPIWLGFRGGKGVATTFGALTALAWPAALAGGVAWFAFFFLTRTVSIASLVAGIVFPIAVYLLHRGAPPEEWIAIEVFAIVCALLIILRHRANIVRLVRGEELRFGKQASSRGAPADSRSSEATAPAKSGAANGAFEPGDRREAEDMQDGEAEPSDAR